MRTRRIIFLAFGFAALVLGVGLFTGYRIWRGPYFQGESVTGVWFDRIKDPDPAIRKKAIEAQCSALDSNWKAHRVMAAKTLAWYAPHVAPDELKVAVPALTRSLQTDEYEYIRYCAAHTLGAIGADAREAVPILEAVAQEDKGGENLRETAAGAVKKIKARLAAKGPR
jgi:HEAT repeat protein